MLYTDAMFDANRGEKCGGQSVCFDGFPQPNRDGARILMAGIAGGCFCPAVDLTSRGKNDIVLVLAPGNSAWIGVCVQVVD